MIYQTAQYQVHRDSVDKVKQAIKEFTVYIKKNEPGTIMYLVWQKKEDPTSFIHFFLFEDEHAHDVHSTSSAVKKFESVYSPELVHSGVNFTDYEQVATNLVR